MWPAVAAACAAFLVVLGALLLSRRATVRADTNVERVLQELDEHLSQLSDTLARALEHASGVREREVANLEPTLSFDELLGQLLARAAALTGGQAVGVSVQGPGGAPVVASLGAVDDTTLLERALGQRGARQFSAMTVSWAYPIPGPDPAAFRSAVVVPLVEEGVETGAVASYAYAPDAFAPEHVRALQSLASDVAASLGNARRFAEIEQRTTTDALTGVRNRSGYEHELEREVARARRTGRPLSLVLLGVARSTTTMALSVGDADLVLRDFAAVLTRVARTTDILCRRDEEQFAILLPETRSEGAGRFCARLHAQASANALSHVGPLTFSAGIVEWRPDESGDSLDSRAVLAAEQTPSRIAGDAAADSRRGLERAQARTRAFDASPEPGVSARHSFLELLAREVSRAHEGGYPLAVLVLDAGDPVPTGLEQRIGELTGAKGSSRQISPDVVAMVLQQSTVSDAEGLVYGLQASLGSQRPDDADGPRISAGITDLASRDGASSVLARAEQALWQARQAGSGTIVVAVANAAVRR